MACLRTTPLEGRSGALHCDEEGCKLSSFTDQSGTTTVGETSEGYCVLQLRLRVRGVEDSSQQSWVRVGDILDDSKGFRTSPPITEESLIGRNESRFLREETPFDRAGRNGLGLPVEPRGPGGERPTQREEFESEFGFITDEQWQWLKEFVARHYQPNRTQGVVGYKVGGRIHHPSDVEIIIDQPRGE